MASLLPSGEKLGYDQSAGSALSGAVLPVRSSQVTGDSVPIGFARHVEKNARISDGELRSAGIDCCGERLQPPAMDCRELEPLRIEWQAEQDPIADVKQVAGPDIAGVIAAAEENLRLPSRKRLRHERSAVPRDCRGVAL